MLRKYSLIGLGILSSIGMNAFADTKIFINTVPPAREVVVAPRGYASCHIEPAKYQHGVWVSQHQVCQYSRNRGMWVSGHWQCVHLKHNNVCMRWEWAPTRWEGARVAVYNPPRPHANPVVVSSYGAPIVTQPAPVPVAVQPPPQPVVVAYNN